ncbi:TonB-dependent receptor [uncultured Maricaulis sp.]|uniref:TonB-dependent receptor n=1 Tax=uncultured Maricaulis sp. TaxID=174710 RepID=UPI0030DAB9F2
MSFTKKLSLGTAAIALLAAAPAAVHAQQTSSQLRGVVVDASGSPVSGAAITIIHAPSGTASVATTNESGSFVQTGLRVGGPYSITVSASGFDGQAMDGMFLQPGSQAPITVTLNSSVETIVVTGAAINMIDLNNGVGSNYSARDIANQPAANRDVLATIARDPLAFSGAEGQLTVAGVNPRFNGLAIDGSLQQDDFGLGSNTYATARSPISLDAVESASLAVSDYSVTASGFTGGLVNITTRSGTNEFDGSVYYYRQNEEYFGDESDGRAVTIAPFDEKEYGVTLGGPIVEDTLFFFVSYDEFESGSGSDFTIADASDDIDDGFYSALNDLVLTELGYDMGGRPSTVSLPVTSERLLGKLDWNINADHRASFTYQSTEEGGSSISRQNFTTAWYDIPVELTAYTGQLFSDWTPEFSTTLRVNYKEFSRGQICGAGAGNPQLEFVLSQADIAGTALDGLLTAPGEETFIGGCDRFRHANEYNDDRLQILAQGDYVYGDHLFTFGAEYEQFNLFNLFVAGSNGRFIYRDVTEILNNTPQIDYVNVPSNVAADGAAAWGYDQLALFLQDTWQYNADLELGFGIRYERFTQGDVPANDPSILATYGQSSTENLDGKDLILPRASFRWTPSERTTVTGGFGLFAGGEPNVWISNAFQSPTGFARQNSGTAITNFDIPAALLASVAGSTGNAIDVIAPDFEIPSDWKASIRFDHELNLNRFGFNLGDGYNFSAQYLYTAPRDAFIWTNLAQTELAAALPTGVAPDGRTIYADLDDLGIRNLTELGNADGSDSHVFSVSLAKEYDNGFGFFVSYAYQDIQYVSEGNSSRGISSWRGITAIDRNNPEVRTSAYQTSDAFNVALSYERDFVSDLTTRFDIFGQITSGAPYTLTYDVSNSNSLFGRAGDGEGPFDNNPLYIPLSGADPRVVYATGFDQTGFSSFVDSIGAARGSIHEVNSAQSAWNQQWDFRMSQELPGIPGADRWVGENNFSIVLDVINFPNLLNSDWGTQTNGPGNGQLGVVRADLVSAADVAANGVDGATALTGDAPRTACLAAGDCVYRYNSYRDSDTAFASNFNSVYQVRVGLRYEF